MGDAVNIIISVVFVFLVFSLVVSGINEGLSAVFALRSKALWKTINGFAKKVDTPDAVLKGTDLLKFAVPRSDDDPRPKVEVASHVAALETAGNTDTAAPVKSTLVSSPDDLVSGLIYAKTSATDTGRKRTRVKHVSPQAVSEAVVDLGVHQPLVAEAAAKTTTAARESTTGSTTTTGGDTVALESTSADVPSVAATVEQTVQASEAFLRSILDVVRGTELEKPVRAAIAEAKGDIVTFRASIERWFDARMTALSSLYKMWSRWIMLALGIAVAAVLNVNLITTVAELRDDSALAELTAQQATEFVNQISDDGLPDVCPAAADPDGDASDQLVECYNNIAKAVSDARELPPPLDFKGFFAGDDPLWGWRGYFVGVLLAGIALSFGAPFWFDALRKVSSLRR